MGTDQQAAALASPQFSTADGSEQLHSRWAEHSNRYPGAHQMSHTVTEAIAPPVPRWTRRWTLVVGISTLMIGFWTFFFPVSFFEDFPVTGSNWVSALGDYNEHLTRDYGAAQIGLAVAAIGVAFSGRRTEIVSVLTGYVVFGGLHFGYHLGTFSSFSTGSAVTQGLALATFAVLPAILLYSLLATPQKGTTT